MKLCDFGCGKEAKYKFKNGKWCCSKYTSSCLEIRRIYSKSHQGYILTKEQKNKISKSLKGRILTESHKEIIRQNQLNRRHSKESRKKMSISHKLTINQIKKKYPTFAKIEEMRYKPGFEKEKIIQVHCKNHNCKNSKEQGGWFTPKNYDQFSQRVWAIENDEGNRYYYCSKECKQACDLYGKRVSQLMITEDDCQFPYTQLEYKTWRDEVFKRADNKCEYCGEMAKDAHHLKPQKLNPGLALDPEYGIACCKECHYNKGHNDKECTYGYIASQ